MAQNNRASSGASVGCAVGLIAAVIVPLIGVIGFCTAAWFASGPLNLVTGDWISTFRDLFFAVICFAVLLLGASVVGRRR